MDTLSAASLDYSALYRADNCCIIRVHNRAFHERQDSGNDG